jgi:hypothetical protein
VTTSRTPFLTELLAGHSGPPIPIGKRAYFQQRLRIRVFNFLLEKFVQGQKQGLNKNLLAKRIGRSPEVINRWLGSPSNLTLDSISDLLLGIAAEELEPSSSSPLGQIANNYTHFDDLASAQTGSAARIKGASALASSLPQQQKRLRGHDDSPAVSNAQNTAYADPDRNKETNE